jgi:Fe(3+) dicitrate transport protein
MRYRSASLASGHRGDLRRLGVLVALLVCSPGTAAAAAPGASLQKLAAELGSIRDTLDLTRDEQDLERRERLLERTAQLVSEIAAVEAAAEPDPAQLEQLHREVETLKAGADALLAETVKRNVGVFTRVVVVGDTERAGSMPGSAHVVGSEQLERHQHTDIHRILRDVPGVNIQEEDGYGLRPNIGMRGTGVERSQKITLMEDGVLIAPAPYSAPAAYYFPMTGRMEGIEVLKGSSQIKYGPNTNGGALNMVSSTIPPELGGMISIGIGDDVRPQAHAKVGDSAESYGWLLETYQFRADGYKQLDGPGETGFQLQDYLLKLRVNTGAGSKRYQQLELKLSYTDEITDETYLGLTEADFQRNPYRRYAASQVDKLDAEHRQLQLRHLLQLSAGLDITTTFYRNELKRNWYKLDRVSSRGLDAVLVSPEEYAAEYQILTGANSAPGALSVKANNRSYYAMGIETILGTRFRTGALAHELEAGLRYHQDEEDRLQHTDTFQMLDGRMLLTTAGTPGTGSGNNRVGSAAALAFFVHDTIELGRLTIRPGLRFETIQFEQVDYGAGDPQRTGASTKLIESEVSELMPGIGLAYKLGESWRLFAGLHKGFSPPGPGSAEGTEAEESLSYELGARLQDGALSAELIGFHNDYSNLLGVDTRSGGGTGSGAVFNGGAVRVQGLEASAGYDLGQAARLGLSLPLRASYTFTEAEFRSSFTSSFADWAPEVHEGDELPYLPRHQLSLSLGLQGERWGAALSTAYVAQMRTRAGQGPIPEGERVDGHMVLDATGFFSVLPQARLFLNVRNLTDEVYVAARRPSGLRPGMPRTFVAGVRLAF